MADDAKTPAPVDTGAPAAAEEQEEAKHPKPKPGWVTHLPTKTHHHVDDVASTLAAYPGEYEALDKAPAEGSTKIGWPKAKSE